MTGSKVRSLNLSQLVALQDCLSVTKNKISDVPILKSSQGKNMYIHVDMCFIRFLYIFIYSYTHVFIFNKNN
jgi:hypothetical protein